MVCLIRSFYYVPFSHFLITSLLFIYFYYSSVLFPLRALWDTINSAGMERQSLLEESLLSLGEFEDAYSELWAWLTDALRQLGEAEPITGDPDMVAAQLARHKVEREILYLVNNLLF